jgi:hypothetical protein
MFDMWLYLETSDVFFGALFPCATLLQVPWLDAVTGPVK